MLPWNLYQRSKEEVGKVKVATSRPDFDWPSFYSFAHRYTNLLHIFEFGF